MKVIGIVILSWLMVSVPLPQAPGASGEAPTPLRARLGDLLIESWEARWTESQGKESMEVTLGCVNRSKRDVVLNVWLLWESDRELGSLEPRGRENVAVRPGERVREEFSFAGVNRTGRYTVYIRSREGEALVGADKELFSTPPAFAAAWTAYYETARLPEEGHKGYFAKLPGPYRLPYHAENHTACYAKGCHDQRMETEQMWLGTNFRSGARNLHWEHVHKPKGTSCRACHTAEATDQDKMMRRQVPFKDESRMLPLNFARNPDGGSCAVGCHREMAYTRRFNRTFH